MTIRSPGIFRVRGNDVERAVGADILRLVDVEGNRPGCLPLPGDQRLDMEIFAREHFEIVERARDDGADDHRRRRRPGIAFELEQLMEPDRIFIGRATGSVAIRQRALISPPVDEREDEIRIAGIDASSMVAPYAGVHRCSTWRFTDSTSPARITSSSPSSSAGGGPVRLQAVENAR